jgi:uncharacterized protein (TIGR01244 family)
MFRTLDETIMVAPQIGTDAVAEALAQGVTLIINNRPEGESEDQVPGAEIEAAARAAGIDYVAIPVTHSGFSEGQVAAMSDALQNATGRVLAYCRSGTRSTLLWALAQSALGEHPDTLAEKAANAGYDLAPVAPLMEILRAKA